MKSSYFKKGLKLLAIISLLSVGMFAQRDGRSDPGARRWELTEINGKRVYSSQAFLEIDAAPRRFNGSAGCNRIFGSVSIGGGQIDFGNVGATRMFCGEPGVMKLEADFTRALERVTRFEKKGNNLSLYARNRLVLKFKGRARTNRDDDPALRLEDKKWVLESIKNRALPKIETLPFINFDKQKGSAGGTTGCNVFGGNYSVTGDRLAITSLVSTMRACIEDERMNVEREFRNGLENADRFEIKGGKLDLYRNRILLLTFRAENK